MRRERVRKEEEDSNGDFRKGTCEIDFNFESDKKTESRNV